MRRLQCRDVPLINGVIRDAVESDLATRPRSGAGPFDGVVIIERLARREDVEIAGRAAGTARVDPHNRITPWHPYFGIDRFPSEEIMGGSCENIGVLLNQPIPHEFVMFLIFDALTIRTSRHNYRNRLLGLWAINVRP